MPNSVNILILKHWHGLVTDCQLSYECCRLFGQALLYSALKFLGILQQKRLAFTLLLSRTIRKAFHLVIISL